MKKTLSLCQNNRFRQLYNKGKSQVAPEMVVYYGRNRTPDFNRLGITVSTKIGGAVVRNRAKRRLREAYRLLEDRLITGCDIVIVARGRVTGASFSQLQTGMLSAFTALGLMS